MGFNGANGPAEDISFEEEEELLQSFSTISSIDKAWCRTNPSGAQKTAKGQPGKVGIDVTVLMSQRNLPANTTRKFLSSAYLPEPQGDLSIFSWAPFPTELVGVALVAPSPSGQRLFVVRNGEPGKDGPTPTRLEIWGAGRLLKEVYVAASTHGPLYTDGLFEGVAWKEDESAIAYVAEAAPKSKPVFGKPKSVKELPAVPVASVARGRVSAPPPQTKEDEKNSGDAPGSWKGKGEYVEDWGERYTGKGRPLLFVLQVNEGTVSAVKGIPEDLSVGQVIWAPAAKGAQEQTTLVFVGWPDLSSNFNSSKKLGIAYCANRPCALYAAAAHDESNALGSVLKLSGAISSAFSPCFSPDSAFLVFLSSQAAVESGSHGATNSLNSISWPSEGISFAPPPVTKGKQAASAEPSYDVRTIIDVVPRSEEASGFPGLYATSISSRAWLSDGRTLLLTTFWRSTQAIIAVHVESGRVSRLTPEGPISWGLLDVRNNVVVAGASTPACPTKLMLGRINSGWLKQEGWLWSEISPPHVEYPEEVESALKSAEFEVLQVTPTNFDVAGISEGAKQPFEVIFLRRQPEPTSPAPAASAAKVVPAPHPPPPQPLLVIPHGGPHTVTTTNFIMPYAYLCALGYSVLHVNYRGSLGFGEEALQSLPSEIGVQDVEDVLEAVDRIIELGYVDPDRVAVIGGSHGGFLAAHLIGQAPERFRTAVLRNPVTSLASMVGVTDIPDWCFVESLGKEGVEAFSNAPSESHLQAFYKASPIQYVSKVKVPTLFFLGGKDRRVPPSNALEYISALKANGQEVKVIFFPEDSHGLEKPQTEFEQWVTVASWLKTHL